MAQKKIWMTAMEEQLAADQDGSYSKKIGVRLAEKGRELKIVLDKGLPPAEYKNISAIYQAVETAREIVEQAWNRLHPNTHP